MKNVKKVHDHLNGVWIGSFKLRSHLALFARSDQSNPRWENRSISLRRRLVCLSKMWLGLEEVGPPTSIPSRPSKVQHHLVVEEDHHFKAWFYKKKLEEVSLHRKKEIC